MSDATGLIDRIYDAALIPELWTSVLSDVAARADAASGELMVFKDDFTPHWRATERTHDVLGAYIEGGSWRHCKRARNQFQAARHGFYPATQFLSPREFADDPAHAALRRIGLDQQTGTIIRTSTGEMVGLTFARHIESGPPLIRDIDRLNALWPHLARATALAARLRLERADATLSALDAIGLPAATLSARGHVMATNALFEGLDLFASGAFGGLVIVDEQAARNLSASLAALRACGTLAMQSIPVKAGPDGQAAVINLLPLHGPGRDIFLRTDVLMVVNRFASGANVPSHAVLSVVFDLTPSEARLATELARGNSLRSAAGALGISFSTARTYLARIFDKTGTSQQSAMVALVKSTWAAPVH
ncbi:helix-turn-helix transcriptional regulator [Paracoccus pacificus]|uniref:Helix-turn-helix transcriptional regulator n=1 Tax=Paracoccus pacificus TaxID=1463598 RepID=A0ABW4RCF5_9RHOB